MLMLKINYLNKYYFNRSFKKYFLKNNHHYNIKTKLEMFESTVTVIFKNAFR
jgi:hypothetical protein